MTKYSKTDIILDREFYHSYPNGEKEKINKVSESITRITNTINKPDSKNLNLEE